VEVIRFDYDDESDDDYDDHFAMTQFADCSFAAFDS
jgi:hypothetical protein